MITVEQVQTVLSTIRQRNDMLRRRLATRKNRDGRLPETKYDEQLVCRVPELDRVLAGGEQEVEDLMEAYNL